MNRWLIIFLLSISYVSQLNADTVSGFAMIKNIDKFDDLRFVYQRSFHDKIEVVVTREKRADGINLRVLIWPMDPKSGKYLSPKLAESSVPDSIFNGLVASISRLDMIAKSLETQQEGLDGSNWLIELRKGGMRIGQFRHSPSIESDNEFRMIGLRILDLANIQIPKEAIY